MKFGIALGRLNPTLWTEATIEAERLGFESVWMPEHLVLPAATQQPPAATPVFDAIAYLSYLAGRTSTIRLATHVYNLALRHPFIGARAFATLDDVSNGRAIAGIGAGWLEAEWKAAGLDFVTRGRRLDETIGICKRLWTEEVVEHRGDFYTFDGVAFEPKPVQKPHPPVVIGGMSDAALRRAARIGDGWVAMSVPLEEFVEKARALRSQRDLEISTGAKIESPDDVARYEDAGANRLIVAPWPSSSKALAGMSSFAEKYIHT